MLHRLIFRIALIVSLAAFVAGCSVRYGPRIPGFQPGYVDQRLGEQVYQVRIGEAWSKDWPDLEKFAMYRAAELTKLSGCRYFLTIDQRGFLAFFNCSLYLMDRSLEVCFGKRNFCATNTKTKCVGR